MRTPALKSPARLNWQTGLAFEERKLSIFSLKSRVDMSGQPPPELTNGHGVSIHHVVVTYPPEPLVLEQTLTVSSQLHRRLQTRVLESTLNTNISPRRIAMVSKWPSQMLGPKWGLSGAYVG